MTYVLSFQSYVLFIINQIYDKFIHLHFLCFNTCATLPGEITVHPCHRPGRLKSTKIHEHDAFCEKVLFIFNGDSVIKNASMKPHGLLTLKYLLQKQHKQCCIKMKIKC